MEFASVVRRRRMVRAFLPGSIEPGIVDELLDLARRVPSAGNTQPWSFVVLEGADTARLWDVTLPPERRASFRWQGLLDAPVVVVPLVAPDAYVARYAEDDKGHPELGGSVAAWPVPYWWVDGGMVVQTLLLAAFDRGLGALFYGLFDHERPALDALGVPPEWRALGAVALGVPTQDDQPGRSANRPRKPLDQLIHRGGW